MTLPVTTPFWRDRSAHRRWLADEADSLLAFYEPELIDAKGASPISTPAAAAGERPRAAAARNHAHGPWLRHRASARPPRRRRYRRSRHEGDPRAPSRRQARRLFLVVRRRRPARARQLAYGHAFVLLAAASANASATPTPTRCWPTSQRLSRRASGQGARCQRRGIPRGLERGLGLSRQNANMHLTEALMAAYEATDDKSFLAKAESIADLVIRRSAGACDWRVPEHYRADWTVDRDYKGSDMFRPYGVTPGHALEWTRLSLQLWRSAADGWPGCRRPRAPVCARAGEGWTRRAAASITRSNGAARRGCEIGCGGRSARASARRPSSARSTAAPMSRRGTAGCGASPAPFHRSARRRLAAAARRFADAIAGYFVGKPDLYHALQPA